MRISVRPNDSGYGAYCRVIGAGKRISVKFNGEPEYHAVTADTDAGMLVRLAQPLRFDKDRAAFADEVLHGRVEVELYDSVTL